MKKQRLSCILMCIGCLLVLLISACGDVPDDDSDDNNTDEADYNTDDGDHVGPPTGNVIFAKTLAEAMGKVPGEEITLDELATLTHLTFPSPYHPWLPDAGWTGIDLLAHCINLKELDLYGHQIRDLSPLARLTRLERLNLSLTGTSDLEPLAGLINLQKLDLSSNRLSDLTVLAGLIQLKALNLRDNQIRNIAPLANLIQIDKLYLDRNMVADLKPLVDNPGLVDDTREDFDWAGDTVTVSGNPLNDISRNVYIPALQARGVNVRH